LRPGIFAGCEIFGRQQSAQWPLPSHMRFFMACSTSGRLSALRSNVVDSGRFEQGRPFCSQLQRIGSRLVHLIH
jgi:hypothetical protein